MRSNKRKAMWLVLMAAALLLPLIVTACGGEATPAPAPAPAPAATAAPTPAPEPITLRFISPLPPPPYSAAVIAEWFGAEVEKRTKGQVKFEFFHGGTISKPKEELEAIQVGLGDLGFVVHPYYPTKLGLGGFSYAVPFGPSSAASLLKAVDKMYATVPALKAQVEQYNQKVLWHRVIGDYGIISKKPIKTLADLDGVKLASIGAYHPKILHAAGAVPVSMPVSQRYQSVQTGVVDGSVLPFDLNKNIRIHELAKYGTIIGLGAAFSTSVTVNRDVWNKLSPDVQEIFIAVGEEAATKYAAENDALGKQAIEDMKAAGVTFYTMSAADKAKWAEMLPDFPAEWAREMNGKGLPGTRIMQAYLDITTEMGIKHAREWGTK